MQSCTQPRLCSGPWSKVQGGCLLCQLPAPLCCPHYAPTPNQAPFGRHPNDNLHSHDLPLGEANHVVAVPPTPLAGDSGTLLARGICSPPHNNGRTATDLMHTCYETSWAILLSEPTHTGVGSLNTLSALYYALRPPPYWGCAILAQGRWPKAMKGKPDIYLHVLGVNGIFSPLKIRLWGMQSELEPEFPPFGHLLCPLC